MSPVAEVNVTTVDGIRGTIDTRSWPLDGSRAEALLRLADGRSLMTPVELLARKSDGSYRLSLGGTDLHGLDSALESAGGRQVILPLVEEQLLLGKREIETGRVTVRKRVVEELQVVEQPLRTEEVTVERVAMGQIVEGRVAERQEGDTLIIPVFEEVLVVEKRLLLKEEVRVTRRSSEVQHREEATIRKEVVEIERLDGEKMDELGNEGTGIA